MPGPLKVELDRKAPWLVGEFGFQVVYEDYSSEHFGNSIVQLRSDALCVKFVRDRSRIEVHVASVENPEKWMELGFLWYAVTEDRPEPELEGWAWFVRDHLKELAEALGPDFERTKQRFAAKQNASREALEQYKASLRTSIETRPFKTRWLGRFVRGPLGWIIAGGLLAFEVLIRRGTL